jgi:WD40 repeat protein
LVLTGCKNGTVSVFEIGSPDAISQGPIHSKEVKSAAFSEDSRWAITGSEDGVASMWDVKSGIALSPRFQHAIPIANATFSPDCKRVILGSIDGPPQMVDISVGEKRDRDVADLVRLAQLKSSHRIDESGRAVPLSSAESNALWLHLRTKYPNEFSISK